MPVPVNKDKDEMIKMAIAMSLEGQSRVNEKFWRVRRKCWQRLMLVSRGKKLHDIDSFCGEGVQ